MVVDYLNRAFDVLEYSLRCYRRVFAFRMDLRLPAQPYLDIPNTGQILNRFIASFKAKVEHSRYQAAKENAYAHQTEVLSIWCKEWSSNGAPHFHFVMLLNNDAFCTLGKFELGRDNLYNRLIEAWASALGLTAEDTRGLVQFPENGTYLLSRESPEVYRDLCYRVSYLCKVETKRYGDRSHNFGASHIKNGRMQRIAV
ncbi:MAG TPA: inovirus Gp2 family protein [Rhodocyclaceae bacterium]|nr:inovirus Gp2 family protein [Rhodocyclaceae bacterium]